MGSPFQTVVKKGRLVKHLPKMAKKNADKSYGWYKAQDFGDYIERVVGEYGQELEKKKFEDKDETDYLDGLQFCGDLVWNEYQVKQVDAHPRPDTALVNTDVLDTVLLSLHPAAQVKTSEVSEQTKEGLKELHSFSDLIHLEKLTKEDMEHLLGNLPSSYACQLTLMAWFVTLASKMTGKEIPGVGKAPGGKIKKDVKEVEEHLNNFVAIAEAMHKANKWSFLAQYSILKEMCADLCAMAADVV